MSSFQFPKDLKLDIQPYTLLTALSWKMRGKKTQNIKNIQNVEDSLILPIPSNGLTESISFDWESASGLGAKNLGEAFMKNILSKGVDLIGDLGKFITTKRGFLINDYASLAFNGTDFRTFNFTFNLMPKNADESATLRNIINALHRNSLPSYESWKILYPNFWNINIVFPGDKQIIDIKNCAMTELSINEFPDDNQTIHKDGSTIRTEITMGFKELDKLDRKSYQ